MALFIGIPLVAVPGYAIYCRSWRPILHWLGAFIGAFAISALIYFGCELAGFAYEDSGCVPWSGVKAEACDLIGDQ